MLHLILTLLNFIFPGNCFRFHIGINLKVFTGFSVNELSFISLIYTIYIGESFKYFIVVRKFFEFFLYFNKLAQFAIEQGRAFSPTRAPGTRQLLLTNFIWVPVCIKKENCRAAHTAVFCLCEMVSTNFKHMSHMNL